MTNSPTGTVCGSVEPVRSCTGSAAHTAAELVALRDEIAPPALLLLTET
jgi:hypothetical protein